MKLCRNVFANKFDYLVSLVYVTVLVAVFISNSSQSIYLSIDEMTFIEWATIIASTICITLLPGYLFLCVLFKHQNTELKIVLSFFISIAFGSIVGLFNLGIYSFWVYLIPVVIFGISQAYFKIKNHKSQIINAKSKLSSNTIFSLIIIFIVALFCFFAFFQNIGLRGDLWRVFSDSIYINSHGLANYATYYPYFLLSFYSSIFFISSLNLIVVFLLVVSESLIFMTLAFKIVVQRITDNSSIAFIAALVFILFSGLDWVYALPNLLSGNLYSDLYSVGTTHMGGIIYQPWSYGFDHTLSVVGLGASFLVIALILDRKIHGLGKYTLISILTFIAYASYVQEAFLLIYTFFIIFSLKELNKRVMLKESLSLLIGIALVFFYVSLSSSLVEYYRGFTFLLVHVLFLTAYSAFLLSQKYRQLPLQMMWQKLFIHFNRKVKISFGILILILYITGLLIELSFINSLNDSLPWPFWNYFPLYHYPFAFGIAGFLLVGLVLSSLFGLHRVSPAEILSYAILVLSLLMAEAFGWLHIGRPGGMISWIFAFVSINGAIFIFKLLTYSKFKTGRFKSLLSVLICVIFVFGSFSTVLGLNFTNQRPGPYFDTSFNLSESDTALLDFLYSKSSVEIFSIASDNSKVNQIANLAGVHTLSTETNNLYLTSNNPVTVTQLTNDQTIKYVILNSNLTDYGYIRYLLNESQNIHFTDYTMNYTLFEVPFFSSISTNADVGIVYTAHSQADTFHQAVSALAQSNLSYTTYNYIDPAQFTAKTLLLMSNVGAIPWTSLESEYLADGGSVNKSSNGLIFKADDNETRNHDLTYRGLNKPVNDFRYISVSGNSLDSKLWICVHSSISGWQNIYIDKLTSLENFVIDLFDYKSYYNGQYENETIIHNSLKYNDVIDEIRFRVNAPQSTFIIDSVKVGGGPILHSIEPYLDWINKGGSLVMPFDYADEFSVNQPNNNCSYISPVSMGNGSITIIPNNASFGLLTSLFESGQIPLRNQSTATEATPPILWGSPEQPNELSFSTITAEGDIILKSQGGYFTVDLSNQPHVVHKGVEYLKVSSLTMVDSSDGQYVKFSLGEGAKMVYSNGEEQLHQGSIVILKSPIMQINGTMSIQGCKGFSLANKETPYIRGSDVTIIGFSIIEFANQDFNFIHARMPLNYGKISSSVETIYVGHAPSTLYSKLPWSSSEMAITILLSIIFALSISLMIYYGKKNKSNANI